MLGKRKLMAAATFVGFVAAYDESAASDNGPVFSFKLSDTVTASSVTSYTHISPKEGFGVVTLGRPSPSLALEVATPDTGIQFFVNAKGRIIEGSYRGDPAKTRGLIDGMVPKLPKMSSVLQSNMPRELYDALLTGQVNLGALTAVNRDVLSSQIENLTQQLGQRVSADVTNAVLSRIPQDATISLDRIVSLAIGVKEIRRLPQVANLPIGAVTDLAIDLLERNGVSAPNATAAQRAFAAALSRQATPIIAAVNRGAVVVQEQLQNFSQTFQQLNALDTRDFAVDNVASGFNGGKAGTKTILEGELTAGMRATIYNDGLIRAGVETYVGIGVQKWDMPAMGSLCTTPKLGASVFIEAHLYEGLSLGAKGTLEAKLPCSFGKDSVYYTTSYTNASAMAYLKYTFGDHVRNSMDPRTMWDDAAFKDWNIDLFAGSYLADTVMTTTGGKGFENRNTARSPLAGISVTKEFGSLGPVYISGGMEYSGALTKTTVTTDTAKLSALIEEKIPSFSVLRNDFQNRIGLDGQTLATITQAAAGLLPVGNSAAQRLAAVAASGDQSLNDIGEGLRRDLIKQAVESQRRPARSVDGAEFNIQGVVRVGARLGDKEDRFAADLYGGGALGVKLSTDFGAASVTKMPVTVAPMISGFAGLRLTDKEPWVGEEASVFVEARQDYVLPGVGTDGAGSGSMMTDRYDLRSVRAGFGWKF